MFTTSKPSTLASGVITPRPMPEGPEVKHCSKILHDRITGMMITRVVPRSDRPLKTDYRRLARLLPLEIVSVTAIGKRMIIALRRPAAADAKESTKLLRLVVSFRMTGGFMFQTNTHTRAIFHLGPRCTGEGDAGLVRLYYNEVRPMSDMLLFEDEYTFLEWRVDKLGMDPMSSCSGTTTASGAMQQWMGMFGRSRAPIVNFLSNTSQKPICGIGNYLRSEILYHAKINPFKETRSLTREQRKQLFESTVAVMTHSYGLGGHTIKNYFDPLGRPGAFTPCIYGRKKRTNDSARLKVVSQKVGKSKTAKTVFYSPATQRG